MDSGGVHIGRFMISFVVSALSIYLIFIGALYFSQRSILYFPDTTAISPVAGGIEEMQIITTKTVDGLELKSWYRAALNGMPTVVMFHGNAGNIEGRGFKARVFLDAGYGLLLVEYRGYGGNPGEPTEQGLYADARAAMDFLAAKGIKPELTVLYGESLGSGVAVRMAFEMAKKTPVAAVVLEAPYTSITDVAAYHYPYVPVRLMIKDKFNSAAVIEHIKSPLFIFHGEKDATIPIKFGHQLFDKALQPKESSWILASGHNELYSFGAGDLVLNFLKRHLSVKK